MIELIKVKHAHQTRNGALHTPYWQHCVSAANILSEAVEAYAATTDSVLRQHLYLATLGHDLYEDTDVDPAHIAQVYGSETDRLIRCMTNEVSDYDRAAYLDKLSKSADEVLLIKFADLIDNTECVAANRVHFDEDWVTEFYVPIATETFAVLSEHAFTPEWTAVATALMNRLQQAMDALLSEVG